MDREVVWTESALEDLTEIGNIIARDSEVYADAFVNQVFDKGESLETHSERGRGPTRLQQVRR